MCILGSISPLVCSSVANIYREQCTGLTGKNKQASPSLQLPVLLLTWNSSGRGSCDRGRHVLDMSKTAMRYAGAAFMCMDSTRGTRWRPVRRVIVDIGVSIRFQGLKAQSARHPGRSSRACRESTQARGCHARPSGSTPAAMVSRPSQSAVLGRSGSRPRCSGCQSRGRFQQCHPPRADYCQRL